MKKIGPYTQKVIEYFKHPKNMGRMKNPDGIGRVGNVTCGDVMWLYIKIGKDKKRREIIKDIKFETFGCLLPREEVLINKGDWEQIRQVQNGDYVLNGNGQNAQVVETSVRKYKGPVLTIIPFVSTFNKFSVTPEHPIFCIKRHWLKSVRKSSKICEWLRIKERELLLIKPRYILAEDLKESDYLVFVSNKKIKDSPLLTKDIMKLVGYYLAEGYTTANDSVLTFAFSKDENNESEKENISELESLLFKITKKRPKERIRRTAKEVYICSRKWASFFASVAGKLAPYKKLSEEIRLLPFEKQWEMVKTYLKGDGNLYRRRVNNIPAYRVATASRKLAIQIQEILTRGDIFSSIKEDTDIERRSYIEGRKVSAKPLYEISFKLERKHKFIHSSGKYFLVPVRKIEKKYYKGNVYNFQVAGRQNSYLVKGFVVHNCVAAIATSSVITDLAKGKTLDEALKIEREGIVKSLGGLPIIKIHCSVLAASALSEAIYDYFKKKKREIPKELEEKHQRIEKEKGEISQRYKEWIKLEEKMHQG